MIRVTDNEDGTATATVDGPAALVASVVILVAAAFGDDGDCGDENCPVHGDGDGDDESLSESA